MQSHEFTEFSKLLTRAFALYPNAAMSEATASAWFSHLAAFELAVVAQGLERAVRGSSDFTPTAPKVCEHCEALAKTYARPVPDYSRPALSEAPPEISPELRKDFEIINAAVGGGEIDGAKAGAAYLRAIVERL